MAAVVGDADCNLNALQQAFRARITVRGDEVAVEGDPIRDPGNPRPVSAT